MKKPKIKDSDCIAELNLVVPGIEFAKDVFRPRIYNVAMFLDLVWECNAKYIGDYCLYTIKIRGQEEDVELFGKFVEDVLLFEEKLLH